MTTWDDMIALPEQRGDDAPAIVEAMALRDVDLDVDRVRLLISIARAAHRRCLSHWLQTNEPGYMAAPSTGPYAQWERRGRGSVGRFRDDDGLPRAPLAAVYFECNRFYRRELGLRFNPNFAPLAWGQDFDLAERLAMLNGAALLFFLIAQEIDLLGYTPERCSLIHDGYYRRLNKRLK